MNYAPQAEWPLNGCSDDRRLENHFGLGATWRTFLSQPRAYRKCSVGLTEASIGPIGGPVMPTAPPFSATPKARRPAFLSLRRIRLAAGLVLFAYATTHFLNHALGNISVDAMEKGLVVQKFVWQSAPGRAFALCRAFHPHGAGVLGSLRAAAVPLDAA